MNSTFTEDWFSSNIPLWKKHLNTFKGKQLNFLEIGTFEGRSAIWLLENILVHPESKLYAVDHWKYVGEKNKNVYNTFIKNISHFKNKVVVLKGYSKDMLRSNNLPKFDFIYIDANRHSQNVLEDAIMSFQLLKPNGIMIFDDYTHNKEHDINCPRPGIDCFLNNYLNEIKILHKGWQVIIKKNKGNTFLKRKPCFSENFQEPKNIPEIYKNINQF